MTAWGRVSFSERNLLRGVKSVCARSVFISVYFFCWFCSSLVLMYAAFCYQNSDTKLQPGSSVSVVTGIRADIPNSPSSWLPASPHWGPGSVPPCWVCGGQHITGTRVFPSTIFMVFPWYYHSPAALVFHLSVVDTISSAVAASLNKSLPSGSRVLIGYGAHPSSYLVAMDDSSIGRKIAETWC